MNRTVWGFPSGILDRDQGEGASTSGPCFGFSGICCFALAGVHLGSSLLHLRDVQPSCKPGVQWEVLIKYNQFYAKETRTQATISQKSTHYPWAGPAAPLPHCRPPAAPAPRRASLGGGPLLRWFDLDQRGSAGLGAAEKKPGAVVAGLFRWVKTAYPKWNPGKWNQRLKPAVFWWFHFDPYP